MLELILTIKQHAQDGTVRTVGQSGAVQFREDLINSPSVHTQCANEIRKLLRSVAGKPELDDNILVDNITPAAATHLLGLLKEKRGTIKSARIVDDTVLISCKLEEGILNDTIHKPENEVRRE